MSQFTSNKKIFTSRVSSLAKVMNFDGEPFSFYTKRKMQISFSPFTILSTSRTSHTVPLQITFFFFRVSKRIIMEIRIRINKGSNGD